MEPFLQHPLLSARRAQPGFTLIEMLVVLAIIVIITGIALAGQSNFDRTLALNNATYDIGLSIRSAQSQGISSQAYAGTNNSGYGISFSTALPSSYILFADTSPAVAAGSRPDVKPGDGLYDESAVPSEKVKTYLLNNGFSISSLCVYTSAGTRTCSSDGLTDVTVTFSRPNTRTVVKGKNVTWATYRSTCLAVTNRTADLRYVNVAENGQVSVVTTCP